MSTHPTDAPPEPSADDGPRVTRDEVRDLARLRRSRTDRKLAGVAGGIARHLDIDPIVPRVLLVVSVFFGGAGILLYAAAWLVVPVEGTDRATVRLDDRSRSAALGIVGVIAVLAVLGDSLGGWGLPWPVVVGGLVVMVVMLVRGGEPRVHPFLRPGPLPGDGWVDPTPPTTGVPTAVKTPVVRSRRAGPVLFWYACTVIALGAGVLGIVDTAGADVPGSAYPAIALAVSAALLLLGAFWGRAGGLVALGLLAALATAGATAAERTDTGHLTATPTTAASVRDVYRLDVGEVDVDLTRVTDPGALDGRTVRVEIGAAGRVEVVVPDDLDVVVRSSIDAGDRRIFGDQLSDGSAMTTVVDGGPDAPELTLDVSVALGEIVVTRQEAQR